MLRRLVPGFAVFLTLSVWASPVAGATPDALLAGEGETLDLPDGWTYAGARREAGRCTMTFQRETGGTFSLLLTPRDEAAPSFRRSASFNISHVDPIDGMESPEGRLLLHVVASILRNDHGQVDLVTVDPPAAPPSVPDAGRAAPPDPRAEAPSFRAQLDKLPGKAQLQVWVVLFLLALALAAFVLALRLLWEAWFGMAAATRWVVLASLAAAVALRLMVEPRFVMIYWVYGFTDMVAAFRELPRYGAAAATFYRLLFAVTSTDHLVIANVHTVLGILTLPAAVAFLQRHRAGGLAVAVFAVLIAATPMFIRDHRTESILVFGVFNLWYGLLLLDGFLRERRLLCLGGALPFLGLAVLTRPEMVLIVPMAVAVAVVARGRAGLRGARIPLGIAAAAFAALVAVQLVHLFVAVPQQVAAGALPSFNRHLLGSLPRQLVVRNAWLNVDFFPVGITAVAFLGVIRARAGSRGLIWGAGLLAVLWTSVYYIDLPITSEPRLHAPAATLIALIAAVGVEALVELLRPARRRVRGAALAGLCGLTVLSALPSIPSLYAPTNEDQEEETYRRTIASLPTGQACVVQISALDDPPEGKTHRFHPQYLLRPPNRDDKVLSITEWEAHGADRCSDGAYFYLGLLCYAAVSEEADHGAILERVVERRCLFGPDCWRVSFRNLDFDKPPRRPMLSSCARMMEIAGAPVFEADLENLGDNEFGYYPDVANFRVGLYRLQAPTP